MISYITHKITPVIYHPCLKRNETLSLANIGPADTIHNARDLKKAR